MKSDQPFSPQIGDVVQCPEDRGDPAYQGKVIIPGSGIQQNSVGQSYVWVTVVGPTGRKTTWPSNRLAPA